MGKTLIPSWSDCVIGVVVIILFCVTLLLNVLALHYTYSKIRKPSIKKIPHLLVGALSLAGLGIAVFAYPPFIASRFKGEWLYDSGVCNFVAFIIVLFGNLTICVVVLMSLERLGAIVFPFFYKEHVNFRKAVIILLFLVGYSVLLASLPLFLDQIRLNVSTGVCTYAVDSYNTSSKIIVALMVVQYIASIIIMFISNLVVVKTVSLLDRKTMSGEYENRCGERKQHSSNACLNFAKMVGVLAFCYTICWTAILMRILLLYVYGWRNYYYDQIVIVLTTFDPLINHCVCLWIMRKYRDGYASSMGSLMSCFKISDDGIWATTITRLSTISRRSTYSRASTRSSSRQSSKPYFYKQVPQNAENPQHELHPEGDDLPEQMAKIKLDIQDDKLSDKRIVSDNPREWSEIIRELNAEKEKLENDPSSSVAADEIKVLERGALHGQEVTKPESARVKWRNALKKLKAMKIEAETKNLENTGVPQGSILGPSDSKRRWYDALATLHEKKENASEQPSTASAADADLGSQKEPASGNLQKSSSDEVKLKRWSKIIGKLNNQPQREASSEEKQTCPRDSSNTNLPELLREIKVPIAEQEPQLLKDGALLQSKRAGAQNDLPEIVQDTAAKDDGTALGEPTNLETSTSSHEENPVQSIDRTSLEEEEGKEKEEEEKKD